MADACSTLVEHFLCNYPDFNTSCALYEGLTDSYDKEGAVQAIEGQYEQKLHLYSLSGMKTL